MPDVETPPSTPSWLTTEYMENALKKSLKDDKFKIVEFEVKMAAEVGDHYGSQMFRYSFTDQNNKKFSVVVKTLPNSMITEHMDVCEVFEREQHAYSTVLPAVDSFLGKVDPQHERLWPLNYYQEKKPNCVLVLEDLRLSGFTLGNRYGGLDNDHGLLVIKALAKLHAGSLAVLQENPAIIKYHTVHFWSQKSDAMERVLKIPLVGLIRDLPNWSEFDKKDYYFQKLKNLEDVVLDKIFELWRVDETRLNVCLHGDSWVNNFMFKYNSQGMPKAVSMIDFQIMAFGSPVMDLQYFIFSSIKGELKLEKINYFFEKYCETFHETLNKLGIKVNYGLKDLQKDFEEKGFWGFMILCSIYPLVTAPREDMFDPSDYFAKGKELKFTNIFKREEIRKVLMKALDYFDKKELFNK